MRLQPANFLFAILDAKSKIQQFAEQMINQAMETVTSITGEELSIPREEAQSFAWNDIADYALKYQQYDRAIVHSINKVAHLMGIKTIAEFVENDQILEHIGKISIDYAQGYITGKPIAIAS